MEIAEDEERSKSRIYNCQDTTQQYEVTLDKVINEYNIRPVEYTESSLVKHFYSDNAFETHSLN